MLDILQKRRSIRKFQRKEIPQNIITDLLKAALLAPSSRNLCPWEFVVVNDRGLLQKLASAKEHGSDFLQDAPLGIVIIADETKSDVWVEDASIAAIIIQLAAESMGIGSCWIQIRNRMHDQKVTAEDYIKRLLSIPDKFKVEAVLALGYANEEKAPHKEKDFQFNKVYSNEYGRN
ncbi:nitroreductase family protein [Bacillota bacterium LX-D]|nr:nitroreductase family protein [Bacillota bacterium LX-D]